MMLHISSRVLAIALPSLHEALALLSIVQASVATKHGQARCPCAAWQDKSSISAMHSSYAMQLSL